MTLRHPGRVGRAGIRLSCASLLVFGSACRGADPQRAEDHADGRPLVVASIFPVGDLARFLGGDEVAVEIVLPPRASPSTFEPTARQLATLSRASVYLFVGGGMDRWAETLVDPGTEVVRLTDGMPLEEGHAHEGDPGTGNPHVWLDPVLVRDALLPRIEEALVAVAPEHADDIRARGRALADSLGALDAWIRAELAGVPTRGFVSTHSAWTYFARRYGLEEIGSVYDSPGREPSARHLAGLVRRARSGGVRAVFVEPQLGAAGARTVASELGVEAFLLDPEGDADQPERDSYLALMRFNTRQMARALRGV
jgi:zinc transport system substrate-binding protein